MGASILQPVLAITDRELIDWLWSLRICCGVQKSASADVCARCSQKLSDLMLEHRQRVLEGIKERLGPHGFDADETYRDWMMAFDQIIRLSVKSESECVWSAPSHPNDRYKGRAGRQQLMDALEKARKRLLGEGND